MIFHSDWSTGLGTADPLILDTGKAVPWSANGGAGFEVISAAGLGFPSANCLRITCLQANTGFALVRVTGLPVPAVGQSRWFRWYTRIAIADDLAVADDETHPHQDGNGAGDSNWLFHVYHDAPIAGRWMPQFRGENTFPNDRFGGVNTQGTGPQLLKNTTYRFEVRITRASTTTFTMDVRVYDSGNVLLYDGNDFLNQQGAAPINTQTFTINNLPNLGAFNAGLNGLGGTEWFPSTVYMYQGAVAISGTDWLGPYSGGI